MGYLIASIVVLCLQVLNIVICSCLQKHSDKPETIALVYAIISAVLITTATVIQLVTICVLL